MECDFDEVVIATDDDRIRTACEAFGCVVMMTSSDHINGTDRVAEVAQRRSADIVFNIQGDEPLIEPALITALMNVMESDPTIDVGTVRCELKDEIENPNIVKVVTDPNGFALYFGRAQLPYYRDRPISAAEEVKLKCYKHLGLYAYRLDAILRYAATEPTPLELAECLDQLRFLESGMRVKVVDTESDSVGVDTPEDLEIVKRILQRRIVQERSSYAA
jgi:3-deoxy-manno-octulosonate cytidylyltransferase (CMP-KDO synthetase)